MSFLLDINVLIARVDPNHEFHAAARTWMKRHAGAPLATCPLTENGFLRIYGHPKYPGGPGSPEKARQDLLVIRALPTHHFVADSLSLADTAQFPTLRNLAPKYLADLYLLALASANELKFATFDHGVPSGLLPQGTRSLEVIPVK